MERCSAKKTERDRNGLQMMLDLEIFNQYIREEAVKDNTEELPQIFLTHLRPASRTGAVTYPNPQQLFRHHARQDPHREI